MQRPTITLGWHLLLRTQQNGGWRLFVFWKRKGKKALWHIWCCIAGDRTARCYLRAALLGEEVQDSN